jgi:amino acid transporter
MTSGNLRREIGLRDLVLFNCIAVIAVRWLAAAAHVGPGSLALWAAAAAMFFVPSALAVAALARRFPLEGGLYVWTRNAFGDWHAFFCGWCYWISNLFFFPNLVVSGITLASATLGFGENAPYVLPVSVAVLWLALLPNLFGVRIGKWIGNAGAMATCLAGLLLIGVGVAAFAKSGSATPLRPLPEIDFERLNFWSQIAFAFGGLELGAILAGEIRDPERTIPRAAWISGLAIAVFYMLGTLSLLVLMPPENISVLTGLAQAGDAAAAALGVASLAPVLGVLVCAGVVGQLGAWVAGSARIPYVIGIDRYLPPAFAKLHPRWGTPHVSLLAQGAASTLFLAALHAGEDLRAGYQLVVDMTVILYFIPLVYLFATAWKMGMRISAPPGLLVTVVSMALTLVPPPGAASFWLFEVKLAGGCALLAALARWWFLKARRRAAEAARRGA